VARRVNYDDRQHAVYSAGRSLTPALAEFWTEILARYIRAADRPAVVDVGCGIGMYSRLIAEAFDATVTGVDPSARMLEVAAREYAHPRVRYVAGSAEELPLADASCDVAFLSNVLHHVEDRAACARELRRVVRRGRLVLLRGTLPGDLGGAGVPFIDFFPTALEIDRGRVPSLDEVRAMFAGGFEEVAHEPVRQETTASFREYYERVSTRAISTLELIDDEEFEEGMARMRAVAEQETEPRPVFERVDLLVLRRV
jgi:ubiquinone/menaquinone biosynthesis C-methylase UbiE